MNGIYTSDGVGSKNDLWTKYGYLVRNESLRFQVRLPASVELDDLIQAGAIGLINAIENFDPKKGVALKAWIIQCIRWALIDELRERDWVPRRIRTNAREISKVIQRIEQENGGVATEAEVATSMGVSIGEYQHMLAESNISQIYSLDELQEELSDSFEKIDDEQKNLDPLNSVLRKNLTHKISQAIKFLPEREQLLLSLYYQQELNMKEVAELLQLTETRVSQLHSQAIKRLQARVDSTC